MGPIVYTTDQRVQANHPNSSDSIDWNLIIENSVVQDSGIYECQVNTEPKKSKAYILQVVGEYKVTFTFCLLQNGFIVCLK